ncbi:MAG: hypothetical protein HKN07_10110 [Acidimicrobiia bacterium]|nr:hypothetical protein [Acidimicrobiia bacterium]
MERDPAFMWETETLRANRGTSPPPAAPKPTAPATADRRPAEWVSLRAASESTGVSTTTLRNWAKKGRIPGQLIEGRWMISLQAATDRATSMGTPTPNRSAAEVDHSPSGPPPGTVLVPIAAWDRMLAQLGNLHEAGQQLADARERAAKAETEARFLRQQLSDMRQGAAVATPVQESSAGSPQAPEEAGRETRHSTPAPNKGGITGRLRRIAARVRR